MCIFPAAAFDDEFLKYLGTLDGNHDAPSVINFSEFNPKSELEGKFIRNLISLCIFYDLEDDWEFDLINRRTITKT